MAFAYSTQVANTPGGAAKVVTGTFTSTTAGGEVDTGLTVILYAQATPYGAAGQGVIGFNETFPFETGTITLATTTAAFTGGFIAVGY
jgi:hypothetical protein